MQNKPSDEFISQYLSGPTASFTLTNHNNTTTHDTFERFIEMTKETYGDALVHEINGVFVVTHSLRDAFIARLHSSGDIYQIKVTCEEKNRGALFAFRNVASKLDLITKHDTLNIQLPQNPYILFAQLFTFSPELNSLLEQGEFEVVFVWDYSNTRPPTYYIKHKNSEEIHVVNSSLFDFFLSNKTYEENDEFSYKVAENIKEFGMKADVNLIPFDFYSYYKEKIKIINKSTFSIKDIKRKVFLLPYVYEIDDISRNLNQLANGGLLADKVRPGETLDESIKRILREELHLADDYIGAVINPEVSFDRDRENKLTPKLTVDVFIKKTNLGDNARKTLQREWSSLKKDNG